MIRNMNKVRFSWAWIPAALVCLCASCEVWQVIHPTTHDEPAFIIVNGMSSSIIAPDTVLRGQPFAVEFDTFGGGCTRKVARTEVATSGLVSVIRPYNRRTESSGCDAVLLIVRHAAQVRIDQPGTALLRVIGEQRSEIDGPAELTRTVVVK